MTGFVAVFLDFDNSAFKILALVASVVCFAVAQLLVRRYKLYHFGIEEAVAVAAVAFFVVFAGTILSRNDFSTIVAFAAGTERSRSAAGRSRRPGWGGTAATG